MKRFFLLMLSILLFCLSSCNGVWQNEDAAPSGSDSREDSCKEDGSGILQLEGRRYTYTGERSDIAVEQDTVTICRGGTYRIFGTLNEGCLRVAAGASDVVHLILEGVTLTSSYDVPIRLERAACVILELAENSVNTVTDAERAIPNGLEESACIYSECDLIFCGTGHLAVGGRQKNAVTCMGDLLLEGGSLTVSAAEVGVWVRDKLLLKDGTLTVTASKRGIVASNDLHAVGEIEIQGGKLTVVGTEYALYAGKKLSVSGGCAGLSAPALYFAEKYCITVPDWVA